MTDHQTNATNSLSYKTALSFTSSTATGIDGDPSFTAVEDSPDTTTKAHCYMPSSSSSPSLFLTMKTIFESVYKCDSAAMIDETSRCGSMANEALYQGVEVVLKKTAVTCGNGNSSSVAIGSSDNLKDSLASKPFFEYQCFCDDDDFLASSNNCSVPEACTKDHQNDHQQQQKPLQIQWRHERGLSTISNNSGEDRNERNPSDSSLTTKRGQEIRNTSLVLADDETEDEEECVAIRRSKWTAHTKSFYSKINTPAQRDVTTLSDVTGGASSIPTKQGHLVLLQPSKENDNATEDNPINNEAEEGWIPMKTKSDCREE